jgi:hypothetical protein
MTERDVFSSGRLHTVNAEIDADDSTLMVRESSVRRVVQRPSSRRR